MSATKPKQINVVLSKFYCDVNWHFALHTKSLAVAGVYDLGYRVTHRKDGRENGRFFASSPVIANHYGWNEKTVDRALSILLKTGFFVMEWSGAASREPSVYRVLSHLEWTELYPGECFVKEFTQATLKQEMVACAD